MIGGKSVADIRLNKASFDAAYQEYIIGSNFLEVPEYYHIDKERYWQTIKFIHDAGLHTSENIIEIGGGQIAILLTALFQSRCTVADISESFSQVFKKLEIPFHVGNLTQDPVVADDVKPFDLIIMLEVIEHIPVPPYRTFEMLKPLLKPQGKIFLTTPNLFRLRNIIRMIIGRDIFDRFILPMPGVGLGHQMEYSKDHLSWQFDHAGFAVDWMVHDQLGQLGHTRRARFFRRLLSPLLLRKIWREELVALATRKAEPESLS